MNEPPVSDCELTQALGVLLGMLAQKREMLRIALETLAL